MIYYVDGMNGNDEDDGTPTTPWQTLARALATMEPGDVIKLREGVYNEALDLNKRDLVLEADEGHTPVIDGRYGPHLYGDAGYTTSEGKPVKVKQLPALNAENSKKGGWVSAGKLNAKGYSPLFRLSADGIVIRGITFRNAPGRFAVIEGDGVTIESCRMDFCYGGAILGAAGSVGAVIRNNVISRASVKAHDPGAPGAGPDSVTTSIITGGVDMKVTGNIVFLCHGEGPSADKGSIRPYIAGNVVFGCGHWGLGFNNTSGAVFEGNIVYWPDGLHEVFGKDGPADCFVGGSENAGPENPRDAIAPNIIIRRNLFVGGKRAFLLGGAGRPVQFVDSIIEENTIVGRITPGKSRPAFTWSVLGVAPHKNTVVRNNVIVWEPGSDGISYQAGGEVAWSGNVYSELPPAGMRGNDDVVTSADTLVDPFVPIAAMFDPYSLEMPDYKTTFNIDNYRPVKDGPAAWPGGIGYRGALWPAVVEEPEQPEPDYSWLLAEIQSAGESVAAASAATQEATTRIGEAIQRLGVLEDLLEQKRGR